jgi:hypothetical protein
MLQEPYNKNGIQTVDKAELKNFPNKGVPIKDEKYVLGIFSSSDANELKQKNFLKSQHAFCVNFKGT